MQFLVLHFGIHVMPLLLCSHGYYSIFYVQINLHFISHALNINNSIRFRPNMLWFCIQMEFKWVFVWCSEVNFAVRCGCSSSKNTFIQHSAMSFDYQSQWLRSLHGVAKVHSIASKFCLIHFTDLHVWVNGEWCLCVFINQIHIKYLVMVLGMPTDIYSNEMNAPKLKPKWSR